MTIYSMPSKVPGNPNLPKSILTSVISALLLSRSDKPTNATILKEQVSIGKTRVDNLSRMKAKCKVCNRRIRSSTVCDRTGCALVGKEKEEVLDFSNWETTPFEIVTNYECNEPQSYEYTPHQNWEQYGMY